MSLVEWISGHGGDHLYLFLSNYFLATMLFVNVIGGLPGDQPALFRRPYERSGRTLLRCIAALLFGLLVWVDLLPTGTVRPAYFEWIIGIAFMVAAATVYVLYRDAKRETCDV
jgi:hypothetical protein